MHNLKSGLSFGIGNGSQISLLQEDAKNKTQENESKSKRLYEGNRTRKEYIDLARDPSHGGKVLYQGRKEREIGLDLEKQGKLGHIVRDKTPNRGAEFIDKTTGIKWDVKSPVSHPNGHRNPRKGAFEVKRFLKKLQAEFSNGHKVILDTRRLTKEHKKELLKAIEENNYGDKILLYERKSK